MRWRDIADWIVHLLAAITVVVVVLISAANLMASSVHDQEIGRLNREIEEMRVRQKNFDNNAVDWLMQLGENARNLNVGKTVQTSVGTQGGSR